MGSKKDLVWYLYLLLGNRTFWNWPILRDVSRFFTLLRMKMGIHWYGRGVDIQTYSVPKDFDTASCFIEVKGNGEFGSGGGGGGSGWKDTGGGDGPPRALPFTIEKKDA